MSSLVIITWSESRLWLYSEEGGKILQWLMFRSGAWVRHYPPADWAWCFSPAPPTWWPPCPPCSPGPRCTPRTRARRPCSPSSWARSWRPGCSAPLCALSAREGCLRLWNEYFKLKIDALAKGVTQYLPFIYLTYRLYLLTSPNRITQPTKALLHGSSFGRISFYEISSPWLGMRYLFKSRYQES